mgnify:CR=1 FL=1
MQDEEIQVAIFLAFMWVLFAWHQWCGLNLRIAAKMEEVKKKLARVYSADDRAFMLSRWMAEGHTRGYKPGRAFVIFKKKFGTYPDRTTENAAKELILGRQGQTAAAGVPAREAGKRPAPG